MEHGKSNKGPIYFFCSLDEGVVAICIFSADNYLEWRGLLIKSQYCETEYKQNCFGVTRRGLCIHNVDREKYLINV